MELQEFKTKALEVKNTFIFDEDNEKIFTYLLNKDKERGVLIIGGMGTGKTCVVKLFNEVLRKCNYGPYKFADVRDICFDFMCKGYSEIEKYYREDYGDGNIKYPRLIIDDLGIENPLINYYGTQEDVISNLLFLRHGKRTLTHATTNLTLDMLKKRYGDRLFDRFNEMFEIFYLTGESKRK